MPCPMRQWSVNEQGEQHDEQQVTTEPNATSEASGDERWSDDGKLQLEQCKKQQWNGRRQISMCFQPYIFKKEKGAGITDETHIKDLLEVSAYQPVRLAFLTSAPGGMPTDSSGDALTRVVAGATAEQREALLAAGVARRFNQAILAELLPEEEVADALAWLGKARFVDTNADETWYSYQART